MSQGQGQGHQMNINPSQIPEHVGVLREYLEEKRANRAGNVGATRGEEQPDFDIPDHALATCVTLPERPRGMPIGDWLKIIAAILAAIEQFIPKKPEPAPGT
jgi:hypothetical protein